MNLTEDNSRSRQSRVSPIDGAKPLPWNREAEESALGAALIDADAAKGLVGFLSDQDFFGPPNREVFKTISGLLKQGKPVDSILVKEELGGSQALNGQAAPYLHTLVSGVSTPSSWRYYAEIIRKDARLRAIITEGEKLLTVAAGTPTEAEIADAIGRVAELGAEAAGEGAAQDPRPSAFIGGGDFALDAANVEQALWGSTEQVLWSSGEVLLIVGPTGVGKTTLAQRLALARLGFDKGELLGFPVATTDRPSLYLAADRPQQAHRSLKRMVDESERERVNDGLVVHRGPLGFDIAKQPERFAEWVVDLGVGSVFLDSLKDLALELSKDETGSGIARAFGLLVAAGVEVVALHHHRKDSKPRSIDDVYGSTWIPSAAGSVLVLWGRPGDPVLDLSHLKQPAGEVEPVEILIDHDRGTFRIESKASLIDIIEASPRGVSAQDAARHLFGGEPRRADVEKARRLLEREVAKGRAHRRDSEKAGAAHRYFPVERRGL